MPKNPENEQQDEGQGQSGQQAAPVKADRGDDAEPENNEENLAAVAGDGEEDKEGAEDEGAGDAGDEDADHGDEQPARGGSRTVPHARFNEVNIENKRLREELARAQGREEGAREARQPAAATEKPKPYDFEGAEQKYADLLTEGNTKEAVKLRGEINRELVKSVRADAAAEAVQSVTRMTAAERLEEAAADMIETYPFLDDASKEANEDAIEQVIALRDHYVKAKKMSPDKALRKAAEKVGPQYAKPAKNEDEEGEEEEGAEGGAGKDALDPQRRNVTAIARGAKAAGKQPPAAVQGAAGNRARGAATTPGAVEGLTESEFKRLPEREKQKLRGDFVA